LSAASPHICKLFRNNNLGLWARVVSGLHRITAGGNCTMRLLTVWLLGLSVLAAACDRAATKAAGVPATEAAGTDAVNAPPPPREVTIPAGTPLPVVLDTTVGSDISRIEEPVRAHVVQPIAVRGESVLPAGAVVSGVVIEATRSGRVKGRAHLAVQFDSLAVESNQDHERYRIHTGAVRRVAEATRKKDALEIGGPALGGAIIGAIAGGGKGALIGTAVGGGAGTAVAVSTRGKEVRLMKGAALTLRLSEPVTIKIGG
jgi:hypothetical protein